MTNLELMICEAENNGEIDLDTRDQLLSVLTEGGNIDALSDKSRARATVKDALKNAKLCYQKGEVQNGDNFIDVAKGVVQQAKKELETLRWTNGSAVLSFFTAPFTVFLGKYLMMSVLGFAAKTGAYSAYEKGKVSIKTADRATKAVNIATEIQKAVMTVQAIIKSCKSKKESGGKITASDFNIIKGAVMKSYDQYLSQLDQLKKYGHSIAANASKPTSESVLEEIYEAELSGDITPEERSALIEYMED